MNFPQIRISGMGEGCAYWIEMAIRVAVQCSNEPECNEFEKLPVRLVEFLHLTDSQDYFILKTRDLNDESIICGCAITREIFERFRYSSHRPGEIEKNANSSQVHLR